MIRYGSHLLLLILLSLALLSLSNIHAKADDVPKFVDVQKETGVYSGGRLGQTAAWGDYNGDGWQDIVISSMSMNKLFGSRKSKPGKSSTGVKKSAPNGNLLLFMNGKGLSFKDTASASGLPDISAKAAAWADYNNDGYVDLVLGTLNAGKPPLLFKNSEHHTFTDVTDKSGLTKEGLSTRHVIWADYDNDGFVDLFQAGMNGFSLYRNKGDGSFEEVTGPARLGNQADTYGAVWFDADNDGYQDLFLANAGLNRFYINNGDGTFTDSTEKAGLAGEASWMTTSACTGDYNGDGYVDLYITNMGHGMRNALYRNNKDGSFTDVTVDTGTADAGDGRTCAWVDFDADGRLDLFTTNHIRTNKLFRNEGAGKFTDTAPVAGLDRPIDVFSAPWADYDRDGFIDVLLIGHSGIALMKNQGNKSNSLTLKLRGDGKKSNVSAIGARVEVSTPAGVQIREVSGGRGCCEQDMLPLYFGLGKDKIADINVAWPGGKVCTFKGIAVGKVKEYTISEVKCGINPSS